jgi:hypothetical protein
LVPRSFPINAGATVATRAAVEAGTAFAHREPRLGRALEGQVALYLVGGAVVQSIENVLSILRAKLVKQIVGADHTHVDDLFIRSDKVSHRRRKLQVVNDANRCPQAGTSDRALLPPPSHDDDEITSAEDRAGMVAGRTDAARAARNGGAETPDALNTARPGNRRRYPASASATIGTIGRTR